MDIGGRVKVELAVHPFDASGSLRVKIEQFSRAGVAAQREKFGPEGAADDQRRAQNFAVTRRCDVPVSASIHPDERVQMRNRQQRQIAGRKQNRVEIAQLPDRLRSGANRLRLALLRVFDFGAHPFEAAQFRPKIHSINRRCDDDRICIRRENRLHRAPDQRLAFPFDELFGRAHAR